jgi:hypothetical protein
MTAAKTCPVGFCTPPCSDISKANDFRDEFSACADLTIESVRKLCLVGHEVFCLDKSSSILSSRGGRLLSDMYSAAAEGSPKYVPQVCMMDPVRLGGPQSRCRAYICFVRSDVHLQRGLLMVPTTGSPSQAPVPLLMLLDPVAEVAHMPSIYSRLAWTAADR